MTDRPPASSARVTRCSSPIRRAGCTRSCCRPGKAFHTHRGAVAHDDLIGRPEGIVVTARPSGTPYLALRPLLADFVLSMPRGAAVVYPKDAAQIVAMGDVFPGARVLEAGAGSGALTCSLLRAVGDAGPGAQLRAARGLRRGRPRATWSAFFGGPHPAWELRDGDVAEHPADEPVDRVVLDMLAPWEVLDDGVRGAGARAACWSATWPPPRSCRGWWRRCASTARSPSRPPGRRWCGRGTRSGWRSGRSTGWSGTPPSWSRPAGWPTASAAPARQRRPAKAAPAE